MQAAFGGRALTWLVEQPLYVRRPSLARLLEDFHLAQLVPYADLSLPRAATLRKLRVRLKDAHIQLIDVEPVRGLIAERLDDELCVRLRRPPAN